MTVNKIVLAVLSIGLSSQVMALELHNAKVLDHREWTTGGAQGWFKSGNPTTAPSVFSNASARASVNSASGSVNSNIYITGNHSFNITNSNKEAKTYEYQYKLCADNQRCFNYVQHVQVNPGGYVTDSGTSNLAVYFSSAGSYRSSAYTGVKGDAQSEDTANGNIYVRK